MAEWPLETSERECSQCWGDGIASGACMMVSGIAWAVRTFHKGMGGVAVAISATVSDWDHGISGHRDRNPADKVERDFEGAWRRPGEMNASGIASLLAFAISSSFFAQPPLDWRRVR
jgi:hypothetical protein